MTEHVPPTEMELEIWATSILPSKTLMLVEWQQELAICIREIRRLRKVCGRAAEYLEHPSGEDWDADIVIDELRDASRGNEHNISGKSASGATERSAGRAGERRR